MGSCGVAWKVPPGRVEVNPFVRALGASLTAGGVARRARVEGSQFLRNRPVTAVALSALQADRPTRPHGQEQRVAHPSIAALPHDDHPSVVLVAQKSQWSSRSVAATDRGHRRRRSKTEITDEEVVAHEALPGRATAIVKSADGQSEMIRCSTWPGSQR